MLWAMDLQGHLGPGAAHRLQPISVGLPPAKNPICHICQSSNNLLCKRKRQRYCKPLMEKLHDTATECHSPYGITQCYLLPDTSERTPPSPVTQPDRYSIYRPFKGGGLSKIRPRVQRATGPLLLRDSPEPARPEPMT